MSFHPQLLHAIQLCDMKTVNDIIDSRFHETMIAINNCCLPTTKTRKAAASSSSSLSLWPLPISSMSSTSQEKEQEHRNNTKKESSRNRSSVTTNNNAVNNNNNNNNNNNDNTIFAAAMNASACTSRSQPTTCVGTTSSGTVPFAPSSSSSSDLDDAAGTKKEESVEKLSSGEVKKQPKKNSRAPKVSQVPLVPEEALDEAVEEANRNFVGQLLQKQANLLYFAIQEAALWSGVEDNIELPSEVNTLVQSPPTNTPTTTTPPRLLLLQRLLDQLQCLPPHDEDESIIEPLIKLIFHASCAKGFFKTVHYLLSNFRQQIGHLSEQLHGETPLHAAAFYGHLDVIKVLIAFGAEPDSATNIEGFLASGVARNRGCVAVARFLESGEDTYQPASNLFCKQVLGCCNEDFEYSIMQRDFIATSINSRSNTNSTPPTTTNAGKSSS